MEVTFLHIAEYANTTVDQKLNVMGIFNNIKAAQFPATHPEMYIVTQLTATPSEYGRNFRLAIKLLNEDASNEIISFTNQLSVPTGNEGLPISMNFLLRLINTNFPSPGRYGFYVLVDDDTKGELTLDVIELTESSS